MPTAFYPYCKTCAKSSHSSWYKAYPERIKAIFELWPLLKAIMGCRGAEELEFSWWRMHDSQDNDDRPEEWMRRHDGHQWAIQDEYGDVFDLEEIDSE